MAIIPFHYVMFIYLQIKCIFHKQNLLADGFLRQIIAQQNLLKEIILGMADDLQKIASNKRKDLDLDAVNESLFKKFNFPLKTSQEVEINLNEYFENEENYKFAVSYF